MIVETDLELIKDAFTAKEIKANAKPFRKANGRSNLLFIDLDGEIMKIDRNKASITYDYHLCLATLPFYSHAMRIVYAQYSVGRS